MNNIKEALCSHPLCRFADFRRLFAGRLVSAVGDKFFAIAVAWWVVSGESAASKAHLGFLMAVNFLPVVLFGPFLGALADRANRKTCMLYADFLRFLIIGALALALYAGRLQLWGIYAACFLAAVFIPLFESAVSSALLDITDEQSLAAATAADSSTTQLSGVAGAALGSVLIAVTGVIGAFAFNALSFLFSFAAIFGIKTDLSRRKTAQTGYLTDLKAGFAYVTGNRPLICLLAAFVLVNFFAAPILIIIPMIVKFTLNSTASWLAALETCFAAGSGVVTLLMSLRKQHQRIYEQIFLSVITLGLTLGFIAFADTKPAVCALLFVAGAALALGSTATMILLQKAIPNEMKGRAFAVLTTLAYAVIPLTLALNGLLSQALSLRFIILLNAGGAAALSFALLLIPRIANQA